MALWENNQNSENAQVYVGRLRAWKARCEYIPQGEHISSHEVGIQCIAETQHAMTQHLQKIAGSKVTRLKEAMSYLVIFALDMAKRYAGLDHLAPLLEEKLSLAQCGVCGISGSHVHAPILRLLNHLQKHPVQGDDMLARKYHLWLQNQPAGSTEKFDWSTEIWQDEHRTARIREKEICFQEEKAQLNEKKAQLNEKDAQLNEKDAQLAAREAQIIRATLQLEQRLREAGITLPEIEEEIPMAQNRHQFSYAATTPTIQPQEQASQCVIL